MTWIGWLAIGLMAAILVLDWLIVMGTDPKKWKGGRKQ